MPTPTTRLSLEAPGTSDAFLTSGLDSNLDRIDRFPGTFIGTAAAVATEVGTWSANQLGQLTYTTDTTPPIFQQWNGSTLVRAFPMGRLVKVTNLVGGNFTTGPTTVITTGSVLVPVGGREVEAKCIIPSAFDSTGAATFTLLIDSTVIQTVPLTQNVAQGVFLFGSTTPSAGSHVYSVEITTAGGSTCGLTASATQPIILVADEV